MGVNLLFGRARVFATAMTVSFGAMAAPGTYTVIDLGPLGQASGALANAMSADGRIAGQVQQRRRGSTGFATGPGGKRVRLLGSLGGLGTQAWGINSHGEVVGTSYPPATDHGSNPHAFVTDATGRSMVDLGTFGGSYSGASAINAQGEVVGEAADPTDTPRAFMTRAGSHGLIDLGTLGGTSAQATGITDDGRVTGWSYADPLDTWPHAFLTGREGLGMVDLGALPTGLWSAAYGVNGSGQVVGAADLGNGHRHAFVTGPGGAGLRDADTANPQLDSELDAVNAGGQAVGQRWHGDSHYHAIVTNLAGTAVYPLTTLADAPASVELITAHGIDDAGEVAANGSNGHVYLLVPKTAWTE